MSNTTGESLIQKAWEDKEAGKKLEEHEEIVLSVLSLLNQGKIRVAEKVGGEWMTHAWIKKAILLSFRLFPMKEIFGFHNYSWFDKIPLKTDHEGYRTVPGAIVRHGSFIEKDAILMPSFINIGARVGERTLIDTWSTVGSCAQIGKDCHISGGVGIGGVLEPVQSNPVIIEDNCFIGARSEIAEGVLVEEGAVIAMGVFIGASTKIIHRDTGEILYGRVPAYSVVVPGTLPHPKGNHLPGLSCAVIVKQVDAKTRAKTSLNELLRD